jgi:hypothetical protein
MLAVVAPNDPFFGTPATFARPATQTKKMVQKFYYTPKQPNLTLPLTHSENPGIGRRVIQIRTERLSVDKIYL